MLTIHVSSATEDEFWVIPINKNTCIKQSHTLRKHKLSTNHRDCWSLTHKSALVYVYDGYLYVCMIMTMFGWFSALLSSGIGRYRCTNLWYEIFNKNYLIVWVCLRFDLALCDYLENYMYWKMFFSLKKMTKWIRFNLIISLKCFISEKNKQIWDK